MTSMGTKFQGLYNTSGRAYPDIAAQAFQYLVVWNGTIRAVSGTR
jgi:tripeptidyl-peptidase-1